MREADLPEPSSRMCRPGCRTETGQSSVWAPARWRHTSSPARRLPFTKSIRLSNESRTIQQYFTYLSQCAPSARIVLGDARLRLREATDGQYGLIVLDAFSGDSIPMHLMTREALALYLRKLAPGGLIAFHVSNFYFDFAPTLGNLAQDAHLPAMIANDTQISQAQQDQGKLASIWIVMARNPADLDTLAAGTSRTFRWNALQARPGSRLWTDDYSNLLGVVKSFTSAE